MKLVFMDVEASFVPRDGAVPVTEIACLVMDEYKTIINSFHRHVQPERIPLTGEEQDLAKHVYDHITGLSMNSLLDNGVSTGTAQQELKTWIQDHSLSTETVWVARDPGLEQRVVRDWRIDIPPLREVLDLLPPYYAMNLYSKHTRPQNLRQIANHYHCGLHEKASCHCAMADVMEEFFWIRHFS